MKGLLTRFKLFFLIPILFTISWNTHAQCPGAPSINGSRTPTFTRCNTLIASSVTFPISVSSTSTLSNFKIVWGDGTTDTTGTSLPSGTTVNHSYTTLGQFTIKIISQLPGPCWDTVYGTVQNFRPVSASINPLPSGQNVGCAPHTITFQDSTQNSFPGTTLTWDFGDGTTIIRQYDSANKSISHTYTSGSVPACTTQVSLTANNPNCTIGPSTYTVSPILILDKDQAVITPPTNLCDTGRTYTFQNNTVVNCPTLHAFRIVYWDFGDGTHDASWNSNYGSRTHTFPDTGSYTITLMDSNDCGLSTTTATIVINFPPKPGFTANPKTGCASLTVNFTDTSKGRNNTYLWTFGTGSGIGNSTQKNPSVTYSTPGTFVVRLRVSNNCAPTGRDAYDTIRVYAKPSVSIGNASNGCVPHSVSFQNNTTNNSPKAKYYWTFGNGDTSTLRTPPAITYNSSGTFTVKLVVTDTCGKDSSTATVTVSTKPTASFTFTTVCRGDSTAFTDASTLASGDVISAYKWYFGDGDSSTSSAPKHLYATSGNKTVVLKITTDKTCIDYDTQTVTVKVSPTASIANPGTICDGTVVTLNGTAATTSGTITGYQWTFGGSTTDTAHVEDTSYLFPGPGSYSVLFKATNSLGCSTTGTRTINIRPLPDARPTASPACLGQRTSFRDSSTISSGSVNQWQWDFDNNGVADSTSQNPTFNFSSFGTFRVKLRVGSTFNCYNTDSVDITVYAKPTVGINVSTSSLCKTDSFTFNNTTTGATNYYWTFGDGTDSATTVTTSIKKLYADTGLYNVKMVATTVNGCKDSQSVNINSRPLPVAKFTTNDTIGCAPKLFSFSNTSILSNNYKWFINGTQTTTLTTRPDTTIVQPAQTVQVKLVATNIYGCRPDTAIKTIYTFGNPVPDFTMSTDSGCGPLSVSFTNTTTGAANYQWHLGNDSIATSTNASDVYLASALNDSIYTIKLIALNGPGCSDSISKTVRVFPKPISSFTQDQSANCGPLPVNFTNTSVHKYGGTINNLQFEWSFGNGNTSTSKNIQETFTASAIRDTVYPVQLIATTLFGCKDTSGSNVRVYPNASASFSLDKTDGCAPLNVNFTNTSIPNDTGNISIMTFAWNFVNGNTATSQNTSSTFLANPVKDTIYHVQLIAYSEHGCPDTTYQPVRVYPKPLSSFTPSDTAGCGPFNVSFTNNSTPYDTGSISIMSFVWDFGNGFNSIATNPNTIFVAQPLLDTVYHLNLIAISEHNCRDTSYQDLRVHPKPVISFTEDKTSGCGPLDVQFTDASQLGNTYYWKFGDGDTSSQQNPTHSFASYPLFDSVYTVKFVTHSVYGCVSDTAQTYITARFKPLSDFYMSRDSICTGETISFFNLSTGGASYKWDFANGQTSTTINPSSSFTGVLGRDSVYTIRLVTTSPYQCRDTAYKSIRVTPPPTTQVTTTLAEMCKLDSFTFTNNTTGGANYEWRFGDGSLFTTNSQNSFQKAYIDSGHYTVTVISISPNGCKDTADFDLTVRPFPVARFVTNDTVSCAPHTFTFTNNSVISNSYQWLVNSTETDTATNRADTLVALPGQLFEVKLIASNIYGCRPDTATKYIRTIVNPTPDFIMSADSGCGPLGITFTNTSVGGLTYNWTLGNGTQTNTIHASTSYSPSLLNDSIYTIKLIAYNSPGCSDSISKTVKVFPVPISDFTTDKTADCGPELVNFTNTSVHKYGGTIDDMLFQWNFANGSTSAAKDTSSVFTASRVQDTLYHVKLVAQSKFGCKDSTTKLIRVYPNAKAQFTIDKPDGCGILNVNFTNTSVPNDTGNIGIMTFKWNFANGNASTQQNASQSFIANLTKDTVYNVQLIAYSEHGCPDTITKPVRVYPKPLSKFVASDTAGCGPLNVSFTNQSTPYDTGSIGIMSFIWDLGNGFNNVTQDASTQYYAQLLSDGVYDISLVGISEHGCKDTSYQTIRVHPKPLIGFTTNKTQGCGPLDITFTNTTQLGSTYTWNFGDGDTSSAASPSHTYQSYSMVDSIYPVSLSALSTYGCASDTAITNIIARYKPVADFIPASDSICGTGNILFFNTSVGGNTNAWDFGNGYSSTAYNPSSNFTSVTGKDTSYTVRLVITSPFQCRDTTYRQVKINNLPDASFVNIAPGCTPLGVTFTNQSLYATHYEWELGDATTDTAAQPQRTFTNGLALTNRNYDIILKAYSKSGCMDTAKRTVTVYPQPISNFTANKNLRCDTAAFVMSNTSMGANDYRWDFGDGTSGLGVGASPTHYYRTPIGADTTYTIYLFAKSTDGCSDTASQSVIVRPLVDAKFTSSNTSSCANLDVQFTNLSGSNAISYLWTFGDGSGTTTANPSHRYTNTGNYKVTMIAYDSYGCSDTVEKVNYVNIYEVPSANFLMTPQRPTLPDATCQFTNLSFISLTAGPLTYDWNFGEPPSGINNVSTKKDPLHKYADTGHYEVKLIVTSIFNCRDTFSKNLEIGPPIPNANFTYDPAAGCVPHTVNFTNNSTYATDYSWNFGDAANSTEENPSHTYMLPGTYNVFLRAQGPGGIDDTTQMQIITVYPQPMANFVAAPLNVYLPNGNVDFTNISYENVKNQWTLFRGDDPNPYWQDSSENTSYNFQEDGFFSVRLIVESQEGCLDTVLRYEIVTVNRGGTIYVPNVFTPNGDGTNEIFIPLHTGLLPENYSFRIYDRWGLKVFETDDVKIGWNGTINGDPAMQESYVWIIEGKFTGGNEFTKKGQVTLLR